ncbi:serine/threonine-protein kinase [Streptomyces sp. XD-27]|uniref:serine/threonine-protein kinase n=1 Tax=Streptomyces sp. XD-27 TaxID=3062779 RepID=UPI0026F421BF|nr:serine/threonine-protein kinase [Streptomyces sp. XD-27]WKX70909.1 serine/threonine-protein kinase [Streptomyces sp. XD-27]
MSDEGRLVAGRYRLIERIGRGGMGTVWRAEDELLGRQVAVKQLHISIHVSDDELATLHERTRREARSAARITHPNVVVVHDVVDDGGLPCIVMEYVPSTTLGALLKENGTVSPAEAARIGRGMVAALRAAHAAGVLHRDVKPGNVLLGRGDSAQAEGPWGGRVVLTDFGIAMATGTSTLTKTGEVVGSIDYIAPERVRGRKPGPASDLWALGATLYQALEGRAPFRRDTAMETAYAIAMDPLEPMRKAGPLTGLIEALLAKDPDERPSAGEVERALRAPSAEAATEPEMLIGLSFTTGTTGTTGTAGTTGTRGLPADGGTGPGPGPGTGTGTGTGTEARTGADTGREPAPEPTWDATPVSDITPAPRDDASRTYSPGTVRAGGSPTRKTLLAAMAMVLVAGGGYWAYQQYAGDSGGSGTRAEGTKDPGATDTPTPGAVHTPPPIPAGYHLQYEKQFDVSLPVPNNWSRQVKGTREVRYVDPTGMVGIRFNVLDYASPDPLGHFKDVEEQFRNSDGVDQYRRERMQKTAFRGQTAAVWEMSWRGKTRDWYAIDLGWGREGEREYALYLSAPKEEWDRYSPIFDKVRDGLGLPGDAERPGSQPASGSGQG